MPLQPKRPGIVTFVSIVLIILGSLALLGGLCGAGTAIIGAFQVDDGKPPRPDDPIGGIFAAQRFLAKEVPGYTAFNIAGTVASFVFGVAGLIAGIGVWNLRPMGRMLAMVLSVVHLLYSLGAQGYTIAFVVPAQVQFEKQKINNIQGGPNIDVSGFVAAGAMIGVGCGLAIELTIVLLILIGLNVQSAKVAFGKAPAIPEGAEEGDRPRKKYDGYDDDD